MLHSNPYPAKYLMIYFISPGKYWISTLKQVTIPFFKLLYNSLSINYPTVRCYITLNVKKASLTKPTFTSPEFSVLIADKM